MNFSQPLAGPQSGDNRVEITGVNFQLPAEFISPNIGSARCQTCPVGLIEDGNCPRGSTRTLDVTGAGNKVVIESDRKFLCSMPKQGDSDVNEVMYLLQISINDGGFWTNATDRYWYYSDPDLQGITPRLGPRSGNTLITVSGLFRFRTECLTETCV